MSHLYRNTPHGILLKNIINALKMHEQKHVKHEQQEHAFYVLGLCVHALSSSFTSVCFANNHSQPKENI